jgi:hypothetical protein
VFVCLLVSEQGYLDQIPHAPHQISQDTHFDRDALKPELLPRGPERAVVQQDGRLDEAKRLEWGGVGADQQHGPGPVRGDGVGCRAECGGDEEVLGLVDEVVELDSFVDGGPAELDAADELVLAQEGLLGWG